MSPDRRHQPAPALTDTPEDAAARRNDNPEHTSSKNSSRSSYEIALFAIHNTALTLGVA